MKQNFDKAEVVKIAGCIVLGRFLGFVSDEDNRKKT